MSAAYPCRAHECPLPGTIFPAGAATGICYVHIGRQPNEWPRITQVLADWKPLCDEINAYRRVLTAPETMVDPRAQAEALAAGWERLKFAILGSGWHGTLEPAAGERLDSWGRKLESFLDARILDAFGLQPQRRRA